MHRCATALRRFWRWRDSYDVVPDGVVVGRIFLSRPWTLPVDVDIKRTQGPAASLWLRTDARGRDGG